MYGGSRGSGKTGVGRGASIERMLCYTHRAEEPRVDDTSKARAVSTLCSAGVPVHAVALAATVVVHPERRRAAACARNGLKLQLLPEGDHKLNTALVKSGRLGPAIVEHVAALKGVK